MPKKLGPASLVASVAMLAAVAPAAAQVTVEITPGPGAQFAQQAGISLDVIKMQLEGELNRLFQVYRLKDYLRSFGDAQAFTTRGLGVDYASNLKFFEVGVAANVALGGEDSFLDQKPRTQPVGGLGTNLTFMAGLNFGFLGAAPLTMYGNFFKGKPSYGELAGDLINFGVHLQLKLFGPRRRENLWSALFRWGGLDITTGFDQSRLKLSLGRNFERDIPISDGQRDVATVEIDAQGTFEMDLRTTTIPLEVTTNVRFLYVLSAYAGVGFDWQLAGSSQARVDLRGTMVGRAPSVGMAEIGTATVTAVDRADPTAGKLRGIVGLQANVWFVKAFAQLNFVPDPFMTGLGFGARIAW